MNDPLCDRDSSTTSPKVLNTFVKSGLRTCRSKLYSFKRDSTQKVTSAAAASVHTAAKSSKKLVQKKAQPTVSINFIETAIRKKEDTEAVAPKGGDWSKVS